MQKRGSIKGGLPPLTPLFLCNPLERGPPMFTGSIVAIITPFSSCGEIDWSAFRALIDWHIEEGTDAIVVCGTTGESPTLSCEEQMELIRVAVQHARGRVPIIAGTGTNDTKTSIYKTAEAKKAGVDAALLIFPYYNRPGFEGCLRHFSAIAECNLPMLLYHHPGRTGVKMSAEQLAELSQIASVVGIKEASGSVAYAKEVMKLTSTPLYSGDDALALSTIAAGGKGVISVAANIIPGQWKDCVHAALQQDEKRAGDLFSYYEALCSSLFLETNPQCIKYALSLLGRCTPTLRLPLVEPSPTNRKIIEETMWRYFPSIGKMAADAITSAAP